MSKFSPGDMVVAVNANGAVMNTVSAGSVGTIVQATGASWTCGAPVYVVDFEMECGWLYACECVLRKIEPPEAGNWNECVWSPAKDVA